jgi:hypothetical protein
MTEELRPPPEYTHLPNHWLSHPKSEPRIFKYWGDIWTNGAAIYQLEKLVSDGWTYYAPCIPLVADDATVERVALSVAKYLAKSGKTFGQDCRDAARAAITELLRVEPPATPSVTQENEP